ncbi:unnamed protein product [Menidia menidia]|uniref:UDP-glucuronosyltransferase n=1 Tax=Menidia menidia TaxID=238744 RepID=A0A8S4APG7_9TELE|nr:unnamed protein product [Menidia menidia]CAG5896319.1 unnamed protein product [Menidia menidia]
MASLLLAASLLLLLAASPGARGGNILVFPVDGSHWVNMNLLLRGLHARGHQLTVVRTASSWYVKERAPHYRAVTVALPHAIDIEEPDFFGLRAAKFDLVLMDPGLPVGVLVAHELGLPTVFNVRWITSGEGHFVVAPSPISYVPASGHAATDRMAFWERVANALFYVLNACIDRLVVCPHYDRLVERYLGPDVSFYHLLQGADFWLMRVDFVFEFPRPTMPNVAYIGGFQCGPARPLAPELEAFVQSSGEHGFVLMSLGTLVQGLPADITAEIAAAFAAIPQKVVWRHAGERPPNLGNNTLLLDWIPQNDLLGHPKARAFVAHGGTNGAYEAVFHGVPVVGVPLLFDQFENVLRLQARGAARAVDAAALTRESFLEALEDVLHNPSYRESMRRLSDLHRDRPMAPLDTAMFWVEFVMRHGGAAHLRTESFRMSWLAYHSVDVWSFLGAVLLVLTAAIVGSLRFLCLRVCGRRKAKQEDGSRESTRRLSALHSVDVWSFLGAVLLVLTAAIVGSLRFLCLRVCGRRKAKQE